MLFVAVGMQLERERSALGRKLALCMRQKFVKGQGSAVPYSSPCRKRPCHFLSTFRRIVIVVIPRRKKTILRRADTAVPHSVSANGRTLEIWRSSPLARHTIVHRTTPHLASPYDFSCTANQPLLRRNHHQDFLRGKCNSTVPKRGERSVPKGHASRFKIQKDHIAASCAAKAVWAGRVYAFGSANQNQKRS